MVLTIDDIKIQLSKKMLNPMINRLRIKKHIEQCVEEYINNMPSSEFEDYNKVVAMNFKIDKL